MASVTLHHGLSYVRQHQGVLINTMPIIAFAAAFPLCISTPRATPKISAAHGRGRGARRMDGTSTEQSTEHRRNNGTSTEHRRNIDGTSNNLRMRPAPNPGRAGPRRHRKGPKATTTQTEKQILRFLRNAPHPHSVPAIS